MKNLLALLNPNSGPSDALADMMTAIRTVFDEDPDWRVFYQMSISKEDGQQKIREAKERDFDCVLLAGGDGMINSCLLPLMETGLPLYLLPTGSINGFARHFDIPLDSQEALESLKSGRTISMDIGMANGRPFSVTCSFAWEVEIVEIFEKLKIRGVLPYILSAAVTGMTYTPQKHRLEFDGNMLEEENPLIMTVANVTEYSGMKLIAPPTSIQDGKLELIRVDREATGTLLSHLKRITDETAYELDDVHVTSVPSITVTREKDAPIQLDGELIEEDATVEITVRPKALQVRVPAGYEETPVGVE
jgi:YegS/Rv2252/BmrU family lipid kinase